MIWINFDARLLGALQEPAPTLDYCLAASSRKGVLAGVDDDEVTLEIATLGARRRCAAGRDECGSNSEQYVRIGAEPLNPTAA